MTNSEAASSCLIYQINSVDSVDARVTDVSVESDISVESLTADIAVSESNVNLTNDESVDSQSKSEILDVDRVDGLVNSDLGQASVEALRKEQLRDDSLTSCWAMAKCGKGCYIV